MEHRNEFTNSRGFRMSWFDIVKRKNTTRKKLSLNRKVNGSPVSFTNERQKTKKRREIQDMINATGNEQPRNVMNQKGREQTPQEERNQYEQMLEDSRNEGMSERQIEENEWNDMEHFNEYPPEMVSPSERKDGR
jgi:hypothetical protein